VRCIGGTHLQVADRAMCFFENDYFLTILKTYKDQTFPMLVPVIVNLADNHWHKILQESLVALKTILKEIDPYAFEEALKVPASAKKKFTIKQDDEDRKKMDDKWVKLNTGIKNGNPSFVEPKIPFQSENLIMEYNELYRKIYDKEKFVNL
jgi:serine/threonine-protein phosphatase 2A regulatory subunit B'